MMDICLVLLWPYGVHKHAFPAHPLNGILFPAAIQGHGRKLSSAARAPYVGTFSAGMFPDGGEYVSFQRY